jgi:hypothetical protein
MGRCTLPYRERTVRPIAYYINPEMPPEFQDHVERARRRRAEYRCPPRRGRTRAAAAFVRGASEEIIEHLGPRRPPRRRQRPRGGVPQAARGGERHRPCHAASSTPTRSRRRTAPSSATRPKAAPAGAPAVPARWSLPQPRAPRRQHRLPRGGLQRPPRRHPLQPHHVLAGQLPRALRRHRPLGLRPAHRRGHLQRRRPTWAARWSTPPRSSATTSASHYSTPSSRPRRRPTRQRGGGSASRTSATPRRHRHRRQPCARTSSSRAGRERHRRSTPPRAPRAEPRPGDGRRRGPRRSTSDPWCQVRRTAPGNAGDAHARGARSRPPAASAQHAPRDRHARPEWLAQPRHRPPARSAPRAPSTRPRRCAAWTRRWHEPPRRAHAAPRGARVLLPGRRRPADGGLASTSRAWPGGSRSATAASRPRRARAHPPGPAHRGLQGHRAARDRPLARALPPARVELRRDELQPAVLAAPHPQRRRRRGLPRRRARRGNRATDATSATWTATTTTAWAALHRPGDDEELGVRPLDAGNHHAGITTSATPPTMEYQWERFGETVGLGAYDHYAMGILYGRVVETMESDPARGGNPPSAAPLLLAAPLAALRARLATGRTRFSAPGDGEPGAAPPIHYTELARQMAVFDPARCRDATPRSAARYRWRLVDGKICRRPRDHAALDDMETSQTDFRPRARGVGDPDNAPSWRVRAGTPTAARHRRQRPPLALPRAWDRGTGYPHINYFDQGADIYEVTQSIIAQVRDDVPRDVLPPRQPRVGVGVSRRVASRSMFRLCAATTGTSRATRPTTAGRPQRRELRPSDAASDNALGPTSSRRPEIFDFFAGVMLRPSRACTRGPQADATAPTPELFDAHRHLRRNDGSTRASASASSTGASSATSTTTARAARWDYQSYANRAGLLPGEAPRGDHAHRHAPDLLASPATSTSTAASSR